jgi:hypothetical protein
VQKKKLFLAVETGAENTTLRSAREARTLAGLLWDMYGSGKGPVRESARNSLGVAFDGFEFLVNTTTIDDQYFAAVAKAKRDSEVFIPPTLPYFDVLFDELRRLFLTGDTSKPYYLSVSLPCTRPSILSRTALTLVDFVSVRFMNDVACNINGLAFSNFLTTWGKEIADQSAVDRVGGQGNTNASVAESTVTLTSTRLRTTTVRSSQPVVSAFRLLEPNQFSVLRYTETETISATPTDFDILQYDGNGNLITSSDAPAPTPLYPVDDFETTPWFETSNLEKRQGQTPPYFLLGLPIPSQYIQDFTAQSGVGSADPTTLRNIVEHARSAIPKFVGVLLWGGVEDLEVGQEGGYLDFVKRVLDGSSVAGSFGPHPAQSPSIVITSLVALATSASLVGTPSVMQSRSVMVSNLVELPAPWNEIPTPSPSPTSSAMVSDSSALPTPWNEIPTPSPRLTSDTVASESRVVLVTSSLQVPTSSPLLSASTSVSELQAPSSSMAGPAVSATSAASITVSAETSLQTVALATSAAISSEESIVTVKSTRLLTRTITRQSSTALAGAASSSAMEGQFGVR